MNLQLRRATPDDRELLADWDRQPHVIEASGDDEPADWATELALAVDWQELLIGEADGRPVGAVRLIDPAREASHYWGDIEHGLRAIDIWLGEPDDLGRGYGSEIMRQVIARAFADDTVSAILVDPLAANTRVHPFYERLGFRFVAARRFGSDDCFVYRLERDDWQRQQAD